MCLRPASLADLPKGYQSPVSEVAKAIQLGSGWSKKFQNPVYAARSKPSSAAVVATRAHQVLGPSSRITPVDIAEALVAQGMDWVEPFAPGQPLVPFYGYGRRPRQSDYKVGRNTSTETRSDRIPFDTLEQLYTGYDVARICTRHAINGLRSLRVRFEAMDGYGENPVKEIEEVRTRLRRPDGTRFFKNWLAQNMLSLWKFDSAPIYRLRDKAGNLKQLKNVSAKTIAPMLDYFGDFPEAPAPAFQQFIEGVPWDWLTWDDIIYEPFWPETDSPYGTPPLETVLLNANTDVRLQLYFLQFFTSGAVPEAFAIAPEGMSSPDDLGDFEEFTDDLLDGDQADRWGLKWLPGGTELVFYKPQMFDPDLAEYVMRRTVAAFLQVPHDLGFTDSVNKASGDTQMDVQFRINDLPTVGYYQDLLDAVIQDDWSLPVQIRFDTGGDKEDRVKEAQAHQIYVQMGAEGVDEVREKVLGYAVNPEERIPRFIDSERLGIIPLAHVIAISGEVDPLTGAPKPGSVEPQDYLLPGDGAPIPAAGPTGGRSAPAADAGPKASDPTKVYPLPIAPATKEGLPDEQTGDSRPPRALPSGSANELPGYGTMPVPGGAAQGTGVILGPPELSEDETSDLRKWRANARKAVGRGRTPRYFADSGIRAGVSAQVWSALDGATTRAEVDSAFAKASGPIAGGVVVQAEDTGRVLLVQRTPDHHDPAEAYARWEFPGGHLDDDDAWTGALREWSEETGATLGDFTHVGNWSSPDGAYVGFVVRVPSEQLLTLDPQPGEVSDIGWWSKDDLDSPDVRDKVTETLDRITPLLKAWGSQVRNPRGQWSTHQRLEWSGFHRHTDLIVDHYAPLIEAAMAQVLSPKTIRKALEAGYGTVEKATQPSPSGRGSGLPANQAAAVASGTAGTGAVSTAAGGALGVGGTVATAGSAAAWNIAVAPLRVAAVIAILATAKRALGPLRDLIARLYGEGYLQGAHSAAESTGGYMPPWTATVPVSEDYWTHWQPGVGERAADVAGGGLSTLLRERDIWIKEMTDTQVDRIGAAITEGIEQGFPVAQVTAEVDAIVHDAERALLIAETEFARAQGVSHDETYRLNNVPEVRWLEQPDACPLCQANNAVSPQPTTAQRWPNGAPPVHPHCRCVLAPVIRVPGGVQ